jgi:hypothetical protein
MPDDRGFQPIRRPERDEENLLEELAARKGVGRLQQNPGTVRPAQPPEPSSQPRPAPEGPTPRTRMKTMNLELPDYVMQQLKELALREECSVRHLIMRSLAGQGIRVREADLIADGRRLRGRRAVR